MILQRSISMDAPEEIPDFLLADIEELDERGWAAVAEFAEEGGSAPAALPDSIKWTFAVQDDEVVDAAGAYAAALAEGEATVESAEEAEEAEEGQEPDSDSAADDEEEDDTNEPGIFGGGGW
jgi:hypothetical protein